MQRAGVGVWAREMSSAHVRGDRSCQAACCLGLGLLRRTVGHLSVRMFRIYSLKCSVMCLVKLTSVPLQGPSFEMGTRVPQTPPVLGSSRSGACGGSLWASGRRQQQCQAGWSIRAFFSSILNFFSYIVHFSFQLTVHFFFNLFKKILITG